MTEQTEEAQSGPGQRAVEAGVAIAMIAFGAIVGFGSMKAGIGWGAEGPMSGFFPFYVSLAIIAASLVNLAQSLRIQAARRFASWHALGQVMAVLVPSVIYVGAIPHIGMYVSSILLITWFMIRLGNYSWYFSAILSVAVMAAIYVTFETWFLVPLPKGPLEELLHL